MSMRKVKIFTDGACRGNPGPGGWAAILRDESGREKEIFKGVENTTNNQMELQAVIEGLKALKKPVLVQVYTDSKYVRDGMTSWVFNWEKRSWKTASGKPVKNIEKWKELLILARKYSIEWFWVKGHAGHTENERADALANRGIDEILKEGEK